MLKERIDKHRLERARDYLVTGVSDGALFEHDQEEDDLLCSIDAEKVSCACNSAIQSWSSKLHIRD